MGNAFETIKLERNEDILTVYLNRESRANAINFQMIKELIQLTDYLKEDDQIRFVVFTNKGNIFSAGYDLNELTTIVQQDAASSKKLKLMQEYGQELLRKLETIEQITISAISGSAYGGGVAIALTADFRLIEHNGVLSIPETNIGMFLAWGCTPRLVGALGATKAKELIMLGEDITAEASLELGLVNKIVERQHMKQEVENIIDKLRSRGQQSIAITKKLVNASSPVHIGDVLITESELAIKLAESGESKQLINRFLESKSKVKK